MLTSIISNVFCLLFCVFWYVVSFTKDAFFFPDILRYIERLVGQNKTQKVILKYLERDFNVKGGRLIIYAVAIRTSPVHTMREVRFAARGNFSKVTLSRTKRHVTQPLFPRTIAVLV